jgi:hypothetical protein
MCQIVTMVLGVSGFLVGRSDIAFATIAFYSDRAAWSAVAGELNFSEDFSGFAADTPILRTSESPRVYLGQAQMFIQKFSDASHSDPANFIDVAPLVSTNGSGTSAAVLFVNSTDPVFSGSFMARVFSTQRTRAFGFDYWGANDQEGVLIDVRNVLGQTLGAMQLGDNGFIGYVITGADELDVAREVRFFGSSYISGPIGEEFVIDNLAGLEVPESSAQVLFAIGAAVVSTLRRRHRKVS